MANSKIPVIYSHWHSHGNAECWLERKPETIPYQLSGKEAETHHGELQKMCTSAVSQFKSGGCFT